MPDKSTQPRQGTGRSLFIAFVAFRSAPRPSPNSDDGAMTPGLSSAESPPGMLLAGRPSRSIHLRTRKNHKDREPRQAVVGIAGASNLSSLVVGFTEWGHKTNGESGTNLVHI
jgi:hypothetical protein